MAPGDAVSVTGRDDDAIAVADVVGLYTVDGANQDLLRRVSEPTALPQGLRDHFRKRLRAPDA